LSLFQKICDGWSPYTYVEVECPKKYATTMLAEFHFEEPVRLEYRQPKVTYKSANNK